MAAEGASALPRDPHIIAFGDKVRLTLCLTAGCLRVCRFLCTRKKSCGVSRQSPRNGFVVDFSVWFFLIGNRRLYSEARIGKINVRLAGAVGAVFGSSFALQDRDLVLHHGDGAHVARDDYGESVAAAAAGDDNRGIFAGQDNQALNADAIRDLKAQGASGAVRDFYSFFFLDK